MLGADGRPASTCDGLYDDPAVAVVGKGDLGVRGERYEFPEEPTPSPSPYDGVLRVVTDT